MEVGLRGRASIHVPDDFDRRILGDGAAWDIALKSIARPSALNVDLPGGLRLEGEVFVADGYSVDARDWQRQIKESSGYDARLYLQARATSQVAVDPIDLQLTGPRRTAIELIEYLWKRKFCKAAAQCTVERGAFLVFEWRSEEHTSELQSLMRISYAVFCLKKQHTNN